MDTDHLARPYLWMEERQDQMVQAMLSSEQLGGLTSNGLIPTKNLLREENKLRPWKYSPYSIKKLANKKQYFYASIPINFLLHSVLTINCTMSKSIPVINSHIFYMSKAPPTNSFSSFLQVIKIYLNFVFFNILISKFYCSKFQSLADPSWVKHVLSEAQKTFRLHLHSKTYTHYFPAANMQQSNTGTKGILMTYTQVTFSMYSAVLNTSLNAFF